MHRDNCRLDTPQAVHCSGVYSWCAGRTATCGSPGRLSRSLLQDCCHPWLLLYLRSAAVVADTVPTAQACFCLLSMTCTVTVGDCQACRLTFCTICSCNDELSACWQGRSGTFSCSTAACSCKPRWSVKLTAWHAREWKLLDAVHRMETCPAVYLVLLRAEIERQHVSVATEVSNQAPDGTKALLMILKRYKSVYFLSSSLCTQWL